MRGSLFLETLTNGRASTRLFKYNKNPAEFHSNYYFQRQKIVQQSVKVLTVFSISIWQTDWFLGAASIAVWQPPQATWSKNKSVNFTVNKN